MEIIGTLETLLVLKLEISSRVLSSCVSHDKGITLMESLKRLQEGRAGWPGLGAFHSDLLSPSLQFFISPFGSNKKSTTVKLEACVFRDDSLLSATYA